MKNFTCKTKEVHRIQTSLENMIVAETKTKKVIEVMMMRRLYDHIHTSRDEVENLNLEVDVVVKVRMRHTESIMTTFLPLGRFDPYTLENAVYRALRYIDHAVHSKPYSGNKKDTQHPMFFKRDWVFLGVQIHYVTDPPSATVNRLYYDPVVGNWKWVDDDTSTKVTNGSKLHKEAQLIGVPSPNN
jgi:hypothetical protein